MPFRPELNYLYRIIKQHVERSFPGVSVARGDDRALTRPILEKIADYIKQADVLVADCSGRNPNVFSSSTMVRKGGFEPPRPFGHTVLSRVRLPFRHFRPATAV